MIGQAIADLLFDGPISGLWPMLLLPWLARAISEKSARSLPHTRADWRVAALLAGLPGLVMATLAATALVRGLNHLHFSGIGHFAEYHLPLVVAAAIVGRAVWGAAKRAGELRRLRRLSVPPGPRLAVLARRIGVEVRQLPLSEHECFVAGAMRPLVFVSTGAVELLDDSELAALLHHEKAHAQGNDSAVLLLLSFLNDLFPGSSRALRAYRRTRERHADSQAVRAAGPVALASALLTSSRLRLHNETVGDRSWVAGAFGNECWRLEAILEPDRFPSAVAAARVPPGLAIQAILVFWPAFHLTFVYLLCS